MTNKPLTATAPTFPKLDPASPAFWDVRFEAGFTPWDRGGVPEDFAQFVAAHSKMSTLIPGCGNAHELRLLIAQDWDVMAIDFSPVAVGAARDLMRAQGLSAAQQARVTEADFFDPAWTARRFDCVYECAFLCALPRALRPAWAKQMAAMIRTNGLLAGYFFFDPTEKGPPFGIDEVTLSELLTPEFRLIDSRVPKDSIAVFAGRERWMVWMRT